MSNWYVTRSLVKAAVGVTEPHLDALIDQCIEAASREIDGDIGDPFTHWFLPQTATRRFDWPQSDSRRSWVLRLDRPLLSVSSITKDGTDAVAISASDYFVEPGNDGYATRIEIDLSSSAYFSAKDTHQRAILVTGDWGFCNATTPAGALAEALDNSETGVDVTDSSLADVGHILLCGSERLAVTDRSLLDTTANLTTSLTAAGTDSRLAVNTPSLVKKGETISIESEEMLALSITSTVNVRRGWNDTAIAAHTQPLDIYAYRTLTVERGANGTTAATHDNAAALTRYVPPADVSNWCLGLAVKYYEQGQHGWSGAISGPETIMESRYQALERLRKQARDRYRWYSIGAV